MFLLHSTRFEPRKGFGKSDTCTEDPGVRRTFAELCSAPFGNFDPLTAHVARVEPPNRISSLAVQHPRSAMPGTRPSPPVARSSPSQGDSRVRRSLVTGGIAAPTMMGALVG